MQIKCSYCTTPFAMSKEEAEIAIRQIVEEKQSFYNIHCPHCRRAIKVTKKQIQMFLPYRKLLDEAMAAAKEAKKAAE